ncbi:MAG: ATP-binding protein [Pseudomonadota bacterium]
MAPEVIARAFDPFYTTKPLGEGTGLGLSMTHGFVKQSGGHLHLHSEPGKSTTVTIYLPRYLGMLAAEEAETVTMTSRPDAHAVVLVVEDEPIVRMVMTELLCDQGYKVLEAHSGRSGLSIVEVRRADRPARHRHWLAWGHERSAIG